jgi:hypothetical protein
MKRILKYEEINRKNHVRFSEAYEVKFWFQKEDYFWEQRTEMYFGETKADHDLVIERWKQDYKGKNVKYISVTYQ